MATLEPAATCCGCCPLLWGVRIIATYTTMMGFAAAMSHETPPLHGLSENMAKWVRIMDVVWYSTDLLGIVAGFVGLVGVKTGNSARVRVLFVYYLIRLVVELPMVAISEWAICDVLEAVKALQKEEGGSVRDVVSCSVARYRLAQNFLARVVIEVVFAHAAWSLAVRLATGDLPRFELEALEALRAPLVGDAAGVGGAWAAPPAPGARGNAAGSAPGRARPKQAFRPFECKSYRLD